jgi:hypothetical protein
MAVAKKKPAETEGAKVPAAVDTMPDILLYLEKKDYRWGSSAPPSPRSWSENEGLQVSFGHRREAGLGVMRMKGFRCPTDTAAQLVWDF